MKVKRQKHVRKAVTFYKNNFGLVPPFRILLDGTFCKAALTFKVNISEQMPKYLEGEVKLCTTSCVIAECEALGTLLYGPLKVLRQFQLERCPHHPTVSAAKCLHSMVRKTKDRKYMIATQDQELTQNIRKIAGVPLLFIAYNAITMESPSEISKQAADCKLETRMAPSEHSQTVLDELKKAAFGVPEARKKKRRGPKGPNPLSCRKSKKGTDSGVSERTKKHRKRKHKRVKLPDHIKKELKSIAKSGQ